MRPRSHDSNLHRIRLAGPWECIPQPPLTWPDTNDGAPRRIKLPTSWRDLFGPHPGTATFIRMFNSPTGLTSETLWLRCAHVGCQGTLQLNDILLGTLLADHPQQRFALPALRETGNRLEITLQGESPDDSPRGLWQPVLLEIEQAPNG